MDTNILHKEIDLIQACITRMAHNSFLLKGWTVSLVAVVLALAKDFDFLYLSLLLLLPVLCFWYLDAFFLRTERMYRKMYEWVIANRAQTNDFLYDLNPHRFAATVPDEVRIMFSKTLLIFYGTPAVVLLGGFIYSTGIFNCIFTLLQKGC